MKQLKSSSQFKITVNQEAIIIWWPATDAHGIVLKWRGVTNPVAQLERRTIYLIESNEQLAQIEEKEPSGKYDSSSQQYITEWYVVDTVKTRRPIVD